MALKQQTPAYAHVCVQTETWHTKMPSTPYISRPVRFHTENCNLPSILSVFLFTAPLKYTIHSVYGPIYGPFKMRTPQDQVIKSARVQ